MSGMKAVMVRSKSLRPQEHRRLRLGVDREVRVHHERRPADRRLDGDAGAGDGQVSPHNTLPLALTFPSTDIYLSFSSLNVVLDPLPP